MILSRTCEYAVKIMIYIAGNNSEECYVSLANISDEIASPKAFTAKILQQLVQRGLLDSSKGPKGGFRIKRDKKILLYDVVTAIDGDQVLTKCMLGLEQCSDSNPCPVHRKFKPVRSQLNEIMNTCEITGDTILEHDYTLI